MRQFILTGMMALALPVLLVAQGSDYRFGTTVRINESDTISTNVIAAGQFVDVFGYLGDDIFAASRNLTIHGLVSDDAIVVAQSVTLRGSVGDMLIAAGETIVIDGEVAGDLFAAGNEVRIAANAHIRGNVALAGNEIIFEGGTVDGWLRIAGNDIMVNGTANNFVELYGNDIAFGEAYKPASSTTISTPHEITREDIKNAPADLNIIVEDPDEAWGTALLFSIWFYVSMLIIGIILILVFRETMTDLYRFSTERYLRNTGLGLLLFLAIPIAIIILIVLILTIPLSFIVMMLYGLALFVSFLLVALTLGTKSIRYFKATEVYTDYFWGLALGMILIAILTALPYAGPFLNLLLIFFGLGTLFSYFWQLRVNSI